MDKKAVLAALRGSIEEELARSTRRALDAADAATHEENRAEGDKDMRATEASYIARGQAERVRSLEATLARLAGMELRDVSTVQASALVEVEVGGGGETTTYFIVPAGGGARLVVGGVPVQTLATTSPLGAALLGLVEGDDAEVATPQGTRTYTVTAVR